MTLLELLAAIENAPDDLPLVFETDRGPIGAGYHLTELKLARIESIDCGATIERWRETTLQLLDGVGEDHMPIGTFRKILDQSMQQIDGLGSSPLRIEFAHGNAGMQIYEPEAPEISRSKVALHMQPRHAACKPAARSGGSGAVVECCGAPSEGDQNSADVRAAMGDKAGDQGCCGGPAEDGSDACCVRDAEAKASGKAGCGCADTAPHAEGRVERSAHACCG